jgi:hypothetical protein
MSRLIPVSRRLRRTLLAFLLVVLGCAGEHGASPAPRSYLVPLPAACPAVNPHAVIPRAAPLAADFRPVSVALCTFRPMVVASPEGLSAGWVWATLQRSDGPFDQLTRAMRTVPPPRFDDRICTPRDRPTTYLAFTDAAGRTVVPAIPLNGCGSPLAAIDHAVGGMTWRTVVSR